MDINQKSAQKIIFNAFKFNLNFCRIIPCLIVNHKTYIILFLMHNATFPSAWQVFPWLSIP